MSNWTVLETGVLTDRMPDPDNYCDPQTLVLILEVEDGETLDEQEVRDEYRRRCHCAHDCCGHRNGGVTSINRMWAGHYIVTVSTSLNY